MARPHLLVCGKDLAEMRSKVEDVGWVRIAYEDMKDRIDPLAARVADEPDWLTSRLMMNWETRYVLPVTEGSRWVGGEGRAPVPTPRFGGARDWKTDYTLPRALEDWMPYNGWGDDVRFLKVETREEEWVHPSATGLLIERANQHLMRLAAEAAFLHWLTGEERYAEVAWPVLWTYMEGFSHVLPPLVKDGDQESQKIIGTTSFEVIHENILVDIAICYDFIQPYLVTQGRDPLLIENGIRRMTRRILEGGQSHGNWNLFQAEIAAHGALALQSNEAYPDGQGREYFLDIILNADNEGQLGLMKVVERGYDQETALWPEAPSYAFETTASLLAVANLIAQDPEGRALLADGFLEKAVLAQAELTHPNGLSLGIGDSINVRVNTEAIEMLISTARQQGKIAQEKRLTALLMREIEAGRYRRYRQSTVHALTNYVAELLPVPASEAEQARSYHAKPLNALVMRLPQNNWKHSLSAALFGTAGGHAHANGLAIELFGAGHILGPDPGRGSSYWQRDQRHYYSRMPAHNTVIPNGRADYPVEAPKQLALTLGVLEPAPGREGVSPRVGFAQASFRHLRPHASQLRTLALIESPGGSRFYYDAFHSRLLDDQREKHHDYLFHAQATEALLVDGKGRPLSLQAVNRLGSEAGDMAGYDYFRNERLADCKGGFRARFILPYSKTEVPVMDLWMPAPGRRQLFLVDAPANHAIRRGLPDRLTKEALPTLLVRQKGEAWERPFVAIYQPYLQGEGDPLQSVQSPPPMPGIAGAVVRGNGDWVVVLSATEEPPEAQWGELTFQGAIAVLLGDETGPLELYLGQGRTLGFPGLSLSARGTEPLSASLRKTPEGEWKCVSSGAVDFEATVIPDDAWRALLVD
ncbi:heparinase II/III family protein [Roseibacillus ishigakijimensis]|uniref:Heparinase II/III family protein n=2 Tax=Roseibacillus ishigakijimensis TaxID=454146 RepID=A0A934RNS2_9BACT|nr:heparinase II/III family protein [Roseibacillus ishigakijimensis]MBK1834779.1 heparinase II/III family protein [Roseibacillus ishigakijimensis]